MNENTRNRVLVLAILELVVGAIVVLGGAALVYFSVDMIGKTLGIIHAILGLIGLSAGLLLWSNRRGAQALTLAANVLIIAFSIGSELVLSGTNSLPSDQFVDSIVGTVVAVVIALGVVFPLLKWGMMTTRKNV